MEDVVRRLECIVEDTESAPAMKGVKMGASSIHGPRVLSAKASGLTRPWQTSSKVTNAMETFVSRIEDAELRKKLIELGTQVGADLGPEATSPRTGVYNGARLLRFLYRCEMDVSDARTEIVLNSNARLEFKMDTKRERIVSGNLSLKTIPRMGELFKYQPCNHFLGRGKDGRVVGYMICGSRCDFAGVQKAFSVDDYVEGTLYQSSGLEEVNASPKAFSSF